MGWYYKNRRRCNINKKRLNKLLFFVFLVLFLTILNICYINKKIKNVVKTYVDVEVERLTNNIVSTQLHEVILENDKINLIVDRNSDGTVEKISYDTYQLNNIKNIVTKKISNYLIKLNDGKVDDYFIPERIRKSRFKKYKNGIICDISIDSIYNSILFANVGPTIPMKIVFNEQLNSDIDIDIKEYGINNMMVEVYLVVTIKEQIIMPLTSKRKEIIIREPLSIDIIQGKIPDYYIK